MPSKRTNDSVDRILEDLNIQQAQAGLRDSVTDHQVDEILRSVGISTAPAQPVQGGFAFEADDDLDALLSDPGPAPSQAAPAPRQPAPQAKPAAPQPPRHGNSRSASAIPSAPLRDQPKAPRPQRSRAQHSAVPNEPGLDLISRRPPKQKFANFEDYLAAHGGMTVPLPLAAADAPEAETPAPAAEATE